MNKAKTETFASVWDAIADTPQKSANLRVRSELMNKIASIVERKDWTQSEAADQCGVTQPRINDLLRGRISRFSLDALVNIAFVLGQRVHLELDAVPARRASARRAGAGSGATTHRSTRPAVAARRVPAKSEKRRLGADKSR
jgi:predicted XRE-type DNA-binding protein